MIFKCKHPFEYLAVESPQTIAKVTNDFTEVHWHFICMKCKTKLTRKFSTFTKGVDGFLKESE